MSYLMVAFLVAFLLPIFMGGGRFGLIGLGLQTVLLALIIFRLPDGHGETAIFQMIDLGVVRGLIVPLILISAIKDQKISQQFEFVPANIVYWTGLLVLVAVGLWFGYLLFPGDFQNTMHCGTATAGVLVAFFVLSLQPAGFGQLFAILLLENSIILFEFMNPHHHELVLQVAISTVFIFLILTFRVFLAKLSVLTSSEPGSADRDLL